MSGLSIAKSLELHLLRPGLTETDVRDACRRARAAHLASVLVLPTHVRAAAEELDGSDTRVAAALGYPWGHETLAVRMASLDQARRDGAREVAIALDHSLLMAGNIDAARRELGVMLERASWTSLVNTRAHGHLAIVAETSQLECEAFAPLWNDLAETEAGFVQTSYGLSSIGVADDHLRLLRSLVPVDVGIKAVGGIAELVDALGAINAGASRIGSAAALAIAAQEQATRRKQER